MAEGLGEAPCLGTGDPRRDPAPLALRSPGANSYGGRGGNAASAKGRTHPDQSRRPPASLERAVNP